MFTFKLNALGYTYDIEPANKSSIKFNIALFEDNCKGYRKTINSDIILTDKILRGSGYNKPIADIAKIPESEYFIYVYDEDDVLYYTGRFTGKSIKYNENDSIYTIKLDTYDEYTVYEKLKDVDFNIYLFVQNKYTISDVSSSGIFAQNITSGFYLPDVLNFLISKNFTYENTGYNITLQSEFFTNLVNPVTGIQSKTDSLYLIQSSNVLKSLTIEPYQEATQFLINLKDVLNNLFVMYPDLRWYIKDDKFVLESIATLRNESFNVVNLPANYSKYVERQNEYEFNESEIPQIVKFENANSKYFYFANSKVSYENTSTTTITRQLTCYTDLVGLDVDSDSYSNENYFIVCCNNNTDSPRQIIYETIDYGEVTEFPYFYPYSGNTMNISAENGSVKLIGNPGTTERQIVYSTERQVTSGDKIAISGSLLFRFPQETQIYNAGSDNEYYILLEDFNSITAYIQSNITIYIVGDEIDDLGEQVIISNKININNIDMRKTNQDEDSKSLYFGRRYDLIADDNILTLTASSANARVVISINTKYKLACDGAYYSADDSYLAKTTDVIYANYFQFIGYFLTDTEYSVINNRLSFEYTIPKFYKEDQFESTGLFNDKTVISSNSQKKIKQSKALIQVSKQSDINERNIIVDTVGSKGEVFNMIYDHTNKSYELNILHDINKRDSDENRILDIKFTGLKSWNERNGVIYIEVTTDTDLTAITPDITISQYATISPNNLIEQDFTQPINYIVYSESGKQRNYEVNVYKIDLQFTVKDTKTGGIPLDVFAYLSSSPISGLFRCVIATPKETAYSGTSTSYLVTVLNGTSTVVVSMSDKTKVTQMTFKKVFANVLDLSEFSKLTKLYIVGSTDSLFKDLILPDHSEIWQRIDITNAPIGVLNLDNLNTASNSCIFILNNNNMSMLEVDENLRQIALKGWTSLTIDISGNSVPLNRIAFAEIITAGSGYVVGDILNFIVFAGSGGYETLATYKVTSVNGSGGITGGIINASGTEYFKEVTTSGGSGVGGSVKGYPAKHYLQLKLSATVTTD